VLSSAPRPCAASRLLSSSLTPAVAAAVAAGFFGTLVSCGGKRSAVSGFGGVGNTSAATRSVEYSENGDAGPVGEDWGYAGWEWFGTAAEEVAREVRVTRVSNTCLHFTSVKRS
jgi:hypothetical protein